MHTNTRCMEYSVVQSFSSTITIFQLVNIFYNVLDSKGSLPIIKDSAVSVFSCSWIDITISDRLKINFNTYPPICTPSNLEICRRIFCICYSPHAMYVFLLILHICICVCVCICMRTCIILHEPIYYWSHYHTMFLAVQHYITVPSMLGLALFVI